MNGVHLGLGNIILEKANQFIRAIGLRCVNARIIDFGIALSLGENPDSVKGREEGKIIGSLGFIAPEQFRYPATEPMVQQMAQLLGHQVDFVRLISTKFNDSINAEVEG